MKYLRVTIGIKRDQLEKLTFYLAEAGFSTVEIHDNAEVADILERKTEYDWDVVDESLLALDPAKDPEVVLYLAREEFEDDKDLAVLRRVLHNIDGWKLNKELVDDEDWVENYKKSFTTTLLTDRLVVVPSWEVQAFDPAKEEGRLPIYMDPGMAFGTGDHETTSMCARLMEKWGCEGKDVLDVGTGSGILAIGAAKLGARQVVAVDIDPQAVTVAEVNVENNDCDEIVRVLQGDLLHDVRAVGDVVVANLFAEIVVRLAKSIVDHMKPGACFISTGILKEKEDMVLQALSTQRLKVTDRIEEGGWVALLAERA